MTHFDSHECLAQKNDGSLHHIVVSSATKVRGITLASDRLNPRNGGAPILIPNTSEVSVVKIEPLYAYEQRLLREKSVLLKAKRLRQEQAEKLEVFENILDAVGLILLVVPFAQLGLPEYTVLRISLGFGEAAIFMAKYQNSEEKGQVVMSFIGKKIWSKLVGKGFETIQLKLPPGAGMQMPRMIFRATEITNKVVEKTGEKVADGTFEYAEKKLVSPGLSELDAVETDFLQLHLFKYEFDPSYKYMVDGLEANYKSFVIARATGQLDALMWKSKPTK